MPTGIVHIKTGRAIFYCYGWPHLAYLLERDSADRVSVQRRNLLIDAALGGMWIALMSFNLLPSVLFATVLSMDKFLLGGWRLLIRAILVQAGACLIVGAARGFQTDLYTTLPVILGCIPLLAGYPLALTATTHHLSRKGVQHNRNLASLNRLDALTGLPNRRCWGQTAARELQRHLRIGQPAVLLMIDVDKFKQINDQYGHTVGDEVLQSIANVLCECTRPYDTPGRYGGDEFGLVLPGADLAAALRVAERIRMAVEAERFDHSSSLRCAVSIGAAEAASTVDSVQAWIHRADSALYHSKTAGRNRVSTDVRQVGADAVAID